MNRKWVRRLPAGLIGTWIIASVACAGPVSVTIGAAEPSDAVGKYEFGMFIEPIGPLIAGTLWAEMLDDRKFYYPIVAEGADPPAPAGVEGRPGITYRKWRPIGGDGAVTRGQKYRWR
jgi:alpha-N-arabinofuranosidase